MIIHNIIKEFCPDIKIRTVVVVDLFKLESSSNSPHGLTDFDFNNYFTTDKPVIFNFHGYPNLIHQLIYNAYSIAQKKGYIVRNPMIDVIRPKSNKEDKEVRGH